MSQDEPNNQLIIERYDDYLYLVKKDEDTILHAFTCKDGFEAARFMVFLGFCGIKVRNTYEKRLRQEHDKLKKWRTNRNFAR